MHDPCRRPSQALCKCCNQDLCLEHFWHHNNSITSQLNTLKKEINEIDCRFHFLDIPKSITNFCQQLKQWRIDSYTMIDRFHEQKCQEFNRYLTENVDNQRNNITQLQKRIDEFLEIEYGNQKDIDLIKSNIHDLNGKIQKIEQTSFSITISPLVIDEKLIQIKN